MHSNPKKALFLGLSTGASFAAAADHTGLEAVAVELVPEIIGVLPHFGSVTGKMNENPQLEIQVGDARRYVNSDRSSYDVIIADLFHPSRDGDGQLRERLNALRLKNIYEFLGCYLAGGKDILRFAGTGPLNTVDRPLVMFKAPCTEQEPAFERLFALINANPARLEALHLLRSFPPENIFRKNSHQ